MLDLEAVYNGVGDALRVLDGLRVADLQAEMPPPPLAVVLPLTIDFGANVTFCTAFATIPVLLMTGRPTERTARVNLTRWLPQVVSALQADPTFSGSVTDSDVSSARPSTQESLPGYVVTVTASVLW